MRVTLSLIAIALFAFCGCATTVENDMSTWVGRTEAQVVAAWGAPTRTASDGKDGTILVYDLPTMPISGSVGYFGGGVGVSTHGYPLAHQKTRQFYLNRWGIVYDYFWKGA
jgi:hypothetical protein